MTARTARMSERVRRRVVEDMERWWWWERSRRSWWEDEGWAILALIEEDGDKEVAGA